MAGELTPRIFAADEAFEVAHPAEVIGAALLTKAKGRGWRRIAAELGRPPSTVRRWLVP